MLINANRLLLEKCFSPELRKQSSLADRQAMLVEEPEDLFSSERYGHRQVLDIFIELSDMYSCLISFQHISVYRGQTPCIRRKSRPFLGRWIYGTAWWYSQSQLF